MDLSGRLALDPNAIAAFCKRRHVRRLALFGSVLRDDLGLDSDVDVLVEFEPGKTPGFFTLFDLEEELSPLFGGRRIDLRTREDLSPYFQNEVVAASRPIYVAA